MRTAVRAERTLLEETFDVPAAQHRGWGITLRQEAKVFVRLEVQDGAAVDFYLMTPQQKSEYDEVRQRPFGGQFLHQPQLSRVSTRTFMDSAVLPPGSWSFVVRSNSQVPILGKGSRVYLKITVQG